MPYVCFVGMLGEHTLIHCTAVCQYWELLAKETMEEMKFRRNFQGQIIPMIEVEIFFLTLNYINIYSGFN